MDHGIDRRQDPAFQPTHRRKAKRHKAALQRTDIVTTQSEIMVQIDDRGVRFTMP